jgi:hypothetical protein
MSEDGYDLLIPAISFVDEPGEESMIAFMHLTNFPNVIDPEMNTVIELDHESGKNTEEFFLGFDPWK